MVCLPKKQGGLGVVNTNAHNEALLLKFLHKFYTRADIPWVKLVWDNYYNNDRLSGQQNKGYFWWKDVVKLIDKYKGIASISIADGSTVLFWQDLWNGIIPSQAYQKLYSFAQNCNASFKAVLAKPQLIQNFSLPLSTQAYTQFNDLQQRLTSINPETSCDKWAYIHPGNNSLFNGQSIQSHHRPKTSTSSLSLDMEVKVPDEAQGLFLLLLKDRISTRDLLRRRHIELDFYTCELVFNDQPNN